MSSAIGFALLSLVFSGCIDFLYRCYARVARSRGLYLAAMGITWVVLLFITTGIPDLASVSPGPTLWLGLGAGVAVTASNLLFIESMARLDVSVGSTIYRLNTVGVVALSFVFLGESLPPVKLAGIGAAIAAVLVLYERRSGESSPSTPLLFLGLVILASLARASYGVLTKAGLQAGAEAGALMLLAALCWIAGGLVYAVLIERDLRITRTVLAYGAVSGLVVFLIVTTLVAALARGEASVVVPIANLGFVVALAIAVGGRMERLTVRKTVAVSLAAVAILVLSRA